MQTKLQYEGHLREEKIFECCGAVSCFPPVSAPESLTWFIVYTGIMDAGSVASNVAEAAHHTTSAIADEFKSIGKSLTSQLFGDSADLGHHEIKEMAKKDDKFSEAAASELTQKAKVNAIYEEYYARKKKQEEIEKQKEEQQEEVKKLQELEEEKVEMQTGVKTQIAKTRAEIGGKYYGQE